MKALQFYTTGKQDIIADVWIKPEHNENQIAVKSIYTGICSSDVAMYKGEFTLLPRHMHGHEGLGEVIAVGSNITDVTVGDIVATRGEPAFAQYYNAQAGTYVKVPSAEPKYIIEPVACAVNIARCVDIAANASVAILGTGFLAKIVHTLIKDTAPNITVVGNANAGYWAQQNVTFINTLSGTYDVVFDLSDKPEYAQSNCVNENAIYVLAAEKKPSVTTSFANWLWKNVTVKCPSPRDPRFIEHMKDSVELVKQGIIDPTSMWNNYGHTKLQVAEAFEAAAQRKHFGRRLYIAW